MSAAGAKRSTQFSEFASATALALPCGIGRGMCGSAPLKVLRLSLPMPSKLQRLFVKSPLQARAEVALDADQTHYLLNVLRLKPGDRLLVFNGTNGEWCATLGTTGKKKAHITADHRARAQEAGPDLHYLFAPLKRARLDYVAQKA